MPHKTLQQTVKAALAYLEARSALFKDLYKGLRVLPYTITSEALAIDHKANLLLVGVGYANHSLPHQARILAQTLVMRKLYLAHQDRVNTVRDANVVLNILSAGFVDTFTDIPPFPNALPFEKIALDMTDVTAYFTNADRFDTAVSAIEAHMEATVSTSERASWNNVS